VEITKQVGASRAAGFVNALLRKSAANYSSIHFPVFETDPVAFLSSVQSLPGWLAQRWLKRFDKETIMFLCNTINSIPPVTIRTNTLKTTREQLILSLESEVERIESTTVAPDGIKLINPKRSIPDLPAFIDGWFQVQDEAAQQLPSSSLCCSIRSRENRCWMPAPGSAAKQRTLPSSCKTEAA
jgi:16S rRNA (cytosine967-C5)-methyltransferase